MFDFIISLENLCEGFLFVRKFLNLFAPMTDRNKLYLEDFNLSEREWK